LPEAVGPVTVLVGCEHRGVQPFLLVGTPHRMSQSNPQRYFGLMESMITSLVATVGCQSRFVNGKAALRRRGLQHLHKERDPQKSRAVFWRYLRDMLLCCLAAGCNLIHQLLLPARCVSRLCSGPHPDYGSVANSIWDKETSGVEQSKGGTHKTRAKTSRSLRTNVSLRLSRIGRRLWAKPGELRPKPK
jgi:hypothetical protein